MVDEINSDYLNEHKELILVELYKPDCAPCQQLHSILDDVSILPEYRKIKIAKSHFVKGGLGQKFGLKVEHVPLFLLVRDGQIVQQFPGAKYAQGIGSNRTAVDSLYLKRKLNAILADYCKDSDIAIDSQPIELETCLNLSENSLITLKERYLKKDEQKRVIESPEEMFKRVAENVASADNTFYGKTKEEAEKTASEFYELMTKLKFLPNSPTLMNAGRELQQLSGCFVLPIEDSLESIFSAALKGSLVHKSGGGTGYSFSRIRPKNSRVKTTTGIASGPVSFIDVFDMNTNVIKQGGTRRGANMGVLRVDHPDIREFIHSKGELDEKNRIIIESLENLIELNESQRNSIARILVENTQLKNFNLSVALSEAFIQAVKSNSDFELKYIYSNLDLSVQRVNAKELFNEIVDQAWKTGDPGIIFLDRMNKNNPTPLIGEIEATNPCGEQPLLSNESCNLGSINLAKFVSNREVDYDDLKQTVHTAVHFLDNVIDMNLYPLDEIEHMTKANRKIGLGVMGFADMLTMLRIPYGSDDSIELAKKVMKFIRDEARQASIKLAEERDVFQNWIGSIYDSKSPHFKGEELKLRNATLTTIAPTGTLSMIADCESGIEPSFSLAYTKTVMDGKVLHYRARGLEMVLREEGFDAEEIFSELEQGKKNKFNALPEEIKQLAMTSMKLSPEKHIRIQAAFQEFTDNAVSKTINFPNSATREDIANAYLLAYELGCKGLTIYRDGSKDVQVLSETKKIDYNFGSKIPKERLAIVREETVGDGKTIFVTTSYWENSANQREIKRLRKGQQLGTERPTEFFVDANYFDPDTQALITALAIRCSKDLRLGISPDKIAEDLENLQSGSEVGYDDGFGPQETYVNRSIPDAIQKALSGWRPPVSNAYKKSQIIKEDSNASNSESENGFGFCPNCHRYGIDPREACPKCIHCGASKKGCFS